MTVKSVVKQLPTLRKLAKAKSKGKRILILKNAPKNIYRVLREIIRNTLKGNIPLKKSAKLKLIKHKNYLRKISSGAYNDCCLIINQRGGFLPALLTPVISVLANILAEKIL